jgi:TonB-linked SusC/RagA family outer membrane protein
MKKKRIVPWQLEYDCLKITRIMKILLLLLVVSGLTVSATSVSQNTRVNISVKNVTLLDVFDQIEKSTEYGFLFNNDQIDLSKKYSVNIKDGSIEELLMQVLDEKEYRYSIIENNIIITKVLSKANAFQQNNQQQVTIKGVVVDHTGEPLPGVNVYEKSNPQNGVITGVDGSYSIKVTSSEAQLVYSFIGFEDQEIHTAGRSQINVTLIEESTGLDEVVVVGYGTMKKENLSGAVGTVSADMLEDRSLRSIGEGLQGAVANLNVNITNGRSSSVPNINIRGYESINGGAPLIIIDGVSSTESDLSRLNPSDVESMSVLKDAASCAIYGARASFGVLLITTKKGQGSMRVTYNGGIGFRSPTNLPTMITDPYEVMVAKEAAAYPYYPDLYPDEHVEYAKQVSEGTAEAWRMNPGNGRYWQHFASTNWFDEVYKDNAQTRTHNFSIAGKENRLSYYFSGALFDEEGVFSVGNDQFKRYNLRSRMDFELTDWLTIGNNTSWENTNYEEPAHQSHWLMFHQINRANPLLPVFNPDGSYTSTGAYMIGGLAQGGRANTKTDNIQTQMTAEVNLFNGVWKINGDFTVRKKHWNKSSYQIPVPYKDGPDEPNNYQYTSTSAWQGNYASIYKGINIYTTVAKKIEKHFLSGLVGFNQEESIYDEFSASKKELISPSLPTIQLATGDATVGADYTDWAVRGVFGRLNYSFDEKYILEANARYDGTSRFPKHDRFGFFPSVSLAWRMEREAFMERFTFLSSLKPRFSWGSLGNQTIYRGGTIINYPYISSMSSDKIVQILGGTRPMAIYQPGLVAGSLTWETVESRNLGIDIGLFNSKLSATFDIYERLTKDMLTKSKSLPAVLGTSEPDENAADLKNQGWELTMNWNHSIYLANDPLKYSIGFNLSDSRTWITKFDNPDAYLGDYYVGEEIGNIWGLESLGLYQTPEEVLNHALEDHRASDEVRYKAVGDVRWKDQNGDGYIDNGSWRYGDTGDWKIIGNNQNRLRYGINISADYGNFDLRLFAQGVGKRDFYPGSGAHYFWSVLAQPWAQVAEHVLNDQWSPENTDGYFPRMKAYAAEDGHLELGIPQTRYLLDASYLRLKNVTLGYSLPASLMNKIGTERIRFYVSGENLVTFSEVTKFGFDPEVLDGQGNYPLQKKVLLGVNIVF